MKEIARNEGNNQLNIRKTEVVFLLAFFVYMSANTLDLTAVAFGQGNDRVYLQKWQDMWHIFFWLSK